MSVLWNESVLDWGADGRDLRVSLGGVSFFTRHAAPTDGGVVTLDRLSGWWEGAPDQTDAQDHWSGDGTVAGLVRTGARVVELRGLVKASSMAGALAAKERLTRLRRGLLVVDERGAGMARQAEVRRVDMQFTDHSPRLSSYVLSFVADDPVRYGTSSLDKATGGLGNGTVLVPNRGDAAISPVLELTGPHGAISIQHPGGTYGFAALSTGQSRVLDWRNGDVWNGQTRVFGSETGRRPVVAPGGSSWTVSGLGTGGAVLRRFEGWL